MNMKISEETALALAHTVRSCLIKQCVNEAFADAIADEVCQSVMKRKDDQPIQTNEEKVREIANCENCYYRGKISPSSRAEYCNDCSDVRHLWAMVEWKDEQMLDFLTELTLQSNTTILLELINHKINELKKEN